MCITFNIYFSRAKVDFSLLDESEGSDNSWDEDKKATKMVSSPISKTRILPKRLATKSTKVWSLLEDTDDEEEF